MTGSTQTLPITSPGPIRLPPGSLETVEELPGDSDLEDEQSDTGDSVSDFVLSNIEEDEEEEGGSLIERDPVFDKIKESLTRSQKRSESVVSQISSLSDESDGPQVQISEQYTSIPYGIQPRATYEHSAQQADIMGVAYNGRMRQFVILDPKGITTWKRDLVDPRVRRALQYPKYEYRLIVNIVYAPKYNCYFALGKDFSVKVLNRDFEETCSVNTDMRSVLYILFNPVRDELITGGVGGIKIWQFLQAAGKAFTELKPLANYELKLKESLPNVGGSWVKRVDLDHYLQHLYCCSDTDLHVYDLTGKLLFKFERAHTMSITGCCFSPSAKVLVTASVDSEVKVWSLTGGLVHTFRGHSRAVTGLLLHPDTSTILITSSLDGSIRMWSLDTMDLLYMIVVSADGVMWMGLTDDKMLYISTCRNITLWHLNKFYSFWGVARNSVTHLSLASAESKTTRVLAIGDDSSVRLFTRCNQKNITTVLPPPDISPLQKVLGVCYSREKNAAFLLITNKEIWVYTTRTDPSCRIAVWDVHDLQLPYIIGDTSALPPGVTIQPPSQSMSTHRATENGHGNEIVSNCCSLCILNSTAMMWTEEGLCCPIRHTYLLLGMDDGRVLFMDPVIKGQKYMEFKASKDAIQEMRHDVANSSLITLCRLKTLVMIQIWGLPQLDAMYELYCGPDITCFSRIGLTMMTGHTSGQINCHALEPVEDLGMVKSKLEPAYETVVDEKRRPEHHAPLVAMDALISLQMFVTCSSDGGIKVWDENKVLVTEIMLETSLSAATFLNEMGDLIVGFKNHIFYIDHSKLFPTFKPDEVEMETSDQESDVYEDPRVLYEVIQQDEEPVTLENYLVPYDHLEFDKDFLEGKTKIEQPKGAPDLIEETETETESDISLAPSSIYLSPADSIESLSRIDLTLGADYSKYDLRKQMKSTLDVVFARGQKSRKRVTIETPGQSDMEEKDIEMELEKINLPTFGESPGGSPSITPPSGQASPRDRGIHSEEEYSEEDTSVKKPSGFVPIVPEKGSASPPVTSIRATAIKSYGQNSAVQGLTRPGTFDQSLDTSNMGFSFPDEPFEPRAVRSKHYRHKQSNMKESHQTKMKTDHAHTSKKIDHPEISNTKVTQESYNVAEMLADVNIADELTTHSVGKKRTVRPKKTKIQGVPKASIEPQSKAGMRLDKDYDTDTDEEVRAIDNSTSERGLQEKTEAMSESVVEVLSVGDSESGGDSSSDTESGLAPSLVVESVAPDYQSVTDSGVQESLSVSVTQESSGYLDMPDHASSVGQDSHEIASHHHVQTVEAETPASKVEKPSAEYEEEGEETEQGRRKSKTVKVDVRGLMKKRRITSGRAPSLTRRASTDHSHDDHDHGHDDKRAIKKKQPMDDRKLPPRVDMSKLKDLPPNPPSMLTRKRSMSEQRKSLEINLLHHPEFPRRQDGAVDANLSHVKFDQQDVENLQEEAWAAEAGLHGKPLTLPPQRDKNQARMANKPSPGDTPSTRDRKFVFGNRESVEGQTPGVGSSPTAELEEQDKQEASKDTSTDIGKNAGSSFDNKPAVTASKTQGTSTDGKIIEPDTDPDVVNLDTNIPETQMQRAQRLGLKVDVDKVFENEKSDKTVGLPKVLMRRSKLNVYIPQAERESLSAKSSRRGTPDSGIIDDTMPPLTPQTPHITVSRVPSSQEPALEQEVLPSDINLLTEEDKASAIRRPASSFTGLRRGQLEGERLRSERPHTAHVRFKAEDLQSAFEEALQRYQNLPGTPAAVSAEKLYKNDGVTFEDNWQERAIERHTLLRMQKEIRAQSAAQRRQAMEMIQKDKMASKHFPSRCDSAVGMSDTAQSSLRATTSMSVPITMGYGLRNDPAPSREKQRPKTANPVLEKQQMAKSDLSHEKAFRFRLSKDAPPKSRPCSSRSVSSVADFSPHWIDPRNPDAWRPKSSRSIPSKCNRYVLVNQPREKPSAPVPSPLEEQLLVERFPKMGSKLVHSIPESTPRIKKSYSLEYSPFVYQRFV